MPRWRRVKKNAVKATQRVESGLNKISAHRDYFLVLTKPPFYCQPDIRFESGESCFRMGVETYRMNLESKAYQ